MLRNHPSLQGRGKNCYGIISPFREEDPEKGAHRLQPITPHLQPLASHQHPLDAFKQGTEG
jgi:hypothetical protein